MQEVKTGPIPEAVDLVEKARSPREPSPLTPDPLTILPVRGIVLFPGMVVPITVGRERSVAAAQQAMRENRPIGVILQRDDPIAEPTAIDLHTVGTVANILRYVTTPDGAHHLVCQGLQRFRVIEFTKHALFLQARVGLIDEPEQQSVAIEARFMHLKQLAGEALELLPQAPPELVASLQAVTSPTVLADLTAAQMDIKPEEKQEILETIDLVARLDKVTGLLAQRIEVLRIRQEIGRQTKAGIDHRQREVILREQMAAIQRQLGEDSGKSDEIGGLSEAITKAAMPSEIEDKARKELRRLERM